MPPAPILKKKRIARLTARAAAALGALAIAAGAAVAAEHPAASLPFLSEAPQASATGLAPPQRPQPKLDWETGEGRSYLVPALGILGFDFLLNRFDRAFLERERYDTNLSTIRRNLESDWVWDDGTYAVNQLGHPYQGAMYHGFARSAGLGYWTSAAYTFAGSALWEIAGERTRPSKNDHIASGIGGSFLGEPLFRIANLWLEKADSVPRFWRELGAAAISPATGFNRLAFGERFRAVFPSRDPAYFARLDLGASFNLHGQTADMKSRERHMALADFAIDYGLPGKRDYAYRRPFDYFHLRATAGTGHGLESLMTHGLIAGRDYGAGADRWRGVWGLYGSYDYIAPEIFRVSSVALALGTTAQTWLVESVALQATALLGAGYGAAGKLPEEVGSRDYHFGLTPQALLALRLVFGGRASLELALRDFYVSRVASPDDGRENIARADLGFTYRVHRHHAVSLRYVWSQRDANYPALGDIRQSRAMIGVFYTLLSDRRMGAVAWGGR